MRAQRKNPQQLSAEEIGAWSTLLADMYPNGNAFLSPTFVRAAAQAYGRVEVCMLSQGVGVDAVFAYQFEAGIAQQMRAAVRVAEEMNDYFALIARPDFTCPPAELLRLAQLKYLYFTHLPEAQSRFGLTGENPRGGLRIELPQGGSEYWSALHKSDSKFAGDTERRERKAIREFGELRFVFDDRAPDRLPDLIAHKRAQYLRTGKGDWLASTSRRSLMALLAASREEDCSGTLSTLWFGDTWAAMHFGLRSSRTLHYWFPVYNPELAQFAPGRLLLRNIILHAAENSVAVIDRGLGESQAKNDFPSVSQTFYSGAWHRPGLRSFAYRAYQSTRWRVAGPLSRWLGRQTPVKEQTSNHAVSEVTS